MRLTDLDPRWVSHGGEGITNAAGEAIPLREKIGVSFDCPKCGPIHPGFIPFANPLDGGPSTHEVAWQRTGESFETLTLTPSILRKDCGWHGFITNGEIINA